MENPIQVTLLDSAFRASLYEHAIPAQTVTCYTFIDKTECSSSDTSFYQSFIPLKEIVFGAKSGDRFASVCSISFPLYSRLKCFCEIYFGFWQWLFSGLLRLS